MAFLLRDAKRGTRGGKKLAAAVAGRRSRRSRSSVRPNPFEAERWTAQVELSGIRQVTAAFRKRRRRYRVGHNRPAPQWQGFRTPFFVATPWAPDAVPSGCHRWQCRRRPPVKRDAIGSVLPAIAHLALYAAWLSRPPWHATLMSLKQAIEAEPRKELCEDGAGARSPQPPLSCVSD